MKKKLVILISGSGSNLQSFIDQCASGDLDAEIVCVISNKANAYGLERAQAAGIPTVTLSHNDFASREAYDSALAKQIEPYQPDLIVLAGFMRILTPAFVQQYLGRLINIHPSLLPKYPGLNTHQRAIDAGEKEAGATVHFVTEELDGGPIIAQASVPILEGDTAQTLAKRILVEEHKVFPLAVNWFLEGKLRFIEGKAIFNGEPLPPSGHAYP
ncbi:MAG: phosphoribosylglycinamide formyltransferase [Cellvibrionales bacterium]|nr:phosphoribosylglycinamide formyltransferase [Cellvibrionales bacterium]